MVDLDRRLTAVAARQHCLISLDDVIAAGGTRDHAHDRVERGRWEQPYTGVYRLAGVPWTYEANVLAALMAAGPGAVASHMCAARLLGLGFRNADVEISVPRGRNHRPPGVRVHTSTDLDRCSIVMVDGIACTDPARLILDIGRYIGPVALHRAIQQGRRKKLTTWSDLIRCLAAHARKGRHGITRLRLVIAEHASLDDLSETDSERIAYSIIRELDVPDAVLHHCIYEDDVILADMDLAFVDQNVNLEIDGPVHLEPEVRKKDDARDHQLRRRGWIVRRIWWEIPVRQPKLFARIVREVLEDAANR